VNIDWNDWNVFLTVAETKSMSKAAAALRLGQPTISRKLQFLEGELGYPLFRRSVAGVSLTAAGERLLEPAKKMAEWAGEVGRRAAAANEKPSGVVRVACAPGVAYDFMAPFAAWLLQRQPQLRLEVLSSVHYLDLARGEADLALRNRPAGEDQVTVASMKHENAVFVSSRYGALPKKPKLSDLRWVAWAPPFDEVTPNPQLRALIPGFTPVFTADNFIVLRNAVEAGVGAMVLGRVRSQHALPSALKPVGIELGPYAAGEIHLVCAKSALDIPRVRAVAELLTTELKHVRRL
jgi:DNA-binding transcriptional LysR family regulator